MSLITLSQADKIIDAILARARELKCRPISVVVVEPGAIVKAFRKEDGSAMLRFEMAMGKAYAALALGRSSSLVRVRTEQRPLFMDFLVAVGTGVTPCPPHRSLRAVLPHKAPALGK